MRIGVVGMGWVGSSVAISILHSGLATELLVHDINTAIAEGEALDLAHGEAFYPTATVRAAPLEEFAELDAVVLAAGRGSRPGETRLDLTRSNATIIRGIAKSLGRLRGLLMVVTNPLDIMTLVATDASGLPAARVLGTGTMLDTARLQYVIGQELRVDPRSIRAQVIGEHGDSEVALWSAASAGGMLLRHWESWTRARETELARQVRRAAYEIIARKGATNHAIGFVAAELLRTALRGERSVLTVSRVQDGAAGIRGLAISLPAIIDRDGAARVVVPEMDQDERDGLARSVDALRTAAAAVL